jgi:hypothetical protein
MAVVRMEVKFGEILKLVDPSQKYQHTNKATRESQTHKHQRNTGKVSGTQMC